MKKKILNLDDAKLVWVKDRLVGNDLAIEKLYLRALGDYYSCYAGDLSLDPRHNAISFQTETLERRSLTQLVSYAFLFEGEEWVFTGLSADTKYFQYGDETYGVFRVHFRRKEKGGS